MDNLTERRKESFSSLEKCWNHENRIGKVETKVEAIETRFSETLEIMKEDIKEHKETITILVNQSKQIKYIAIGGLVTMIGSIEPTTFLTILKTLI